MSTYTYCDVHSHLANATVIQHYFVALFDVSGVAEMFMFADNVYRVTHFDILFGQLASLLALISVTCSAPPIAPLDQLRSQPVAAPRYRRIVTYNVTTAKISCIVVFT